jgi:para-nitrobenzyl esterase
MKTREQAEQAGLEFAQSILGASSLEKLRGLSAEELLKASTADESLRFSANIDGWFLPEDINTVYASRKHNDVPLIAGWNLDESSYGSFMKEEDPTVENYAARAREEFGDSAGRFLQLYPASTPAGIRRAAEDYAGDRSTGFKTWKWIEEHETNGKSPVYRYFFDQKLPLPRNAPPDAVPRAAHSWEIEYVFGVISSKDLPWRREDHELSELMMNYWTNFAKHSDPNGSSLPQWPPHNSKDGHSVMFLNAAPGAKPDAHRARLEFIDAHAIQLTKAQTDANQTIP